MQSISLSLAALGLFASGLASGASVPSRAVRDAAPATVVELVFWPDYDFVGNASGYALQSTSGSASCVDITKTVSDVSSIQVELSGAAPVSVSTSFFTNKDCTGSSFTIEGAGSISLEGNAFDNVVASFLLVGE